VFCLSQLDCCHGCHCQGPRRTSCPGFAHFGERISHKATPRLTIRACESFPVSRSRTGGTYLIRQGLSQHTPSVESPHPQGQCQGELPSGQLRCRTLGLPRPARGRIKAYWRRDVSPLRDNSRFAAWIWVYDIDNPSGPHMGSTQPQIPETAPLYYAAFCGFLDVVKRLVNPQDVETLGRDGDTPSRSIAQRPLGRCANPSGKWGRCERLGQPRRDSVTDCSASGRHQVVHAVLD